MAPSVLWSLLLLTVLASSGADPSIECTFQQPPEPHSLKCNGTGTFECGACTCNPGTYGKHCECDAYAYGTNLNSEDYDAPCKMTSTSQVCEGNGQCLCGQCDCNPIWAGEPSKKYSGQYCECDNYSCDYYNGKICGGEERGRCNCGECVCKPGYIGTACECSTDPEPCRAKGSGLICNGHGTCSCGVCRCNRGPDGYYFGRTCEDCPSCPGKCERNRACVLCKVFQSGQYTPDYCHAHCNHVTVVDHAEAMDGWRLCKFRDDEDGCIFYFTYASDSDAVRAQFTKECPVW